MSILFLALRVLGVVLLAVLALAAVAMLLPAGLDIRWRRGGPLEVWLTAGPLRRKFFPFPEETPPGGKKTPQKCRMQHPPRPQKRLRRRRKAGEDRPRKCRLRPNRRRRKRRRLQSPPRPPRRRSSRQCWAN